MNSNPSETEIVSSRIFPFSRGAIFGAFRDPAKLALWWGPKDFKNTFETFEFRPGGQWRFVMHGPDGTNYKNENIFAEIAEPERLVIEHIGWPRFRLTVTLEEAEAGTALTWRMQFHSAEDFAKVRAVCVEANEQNFDRLTAVLAS